MDDKKREEIRQHGAVACEEYYLSRIGDIMTRKKKRLDFLLSLSERMIIEDAERILLENDIRNLSEEFPELKTRS